MGELPRRQRYQGAHIVSNDDLISIKIKKNASLTSQDLSSVKISSLTTSILFQANASFNWFIASSLFAE